MTSLIKPTEGHIFINKIQISDENFLQNLCICSSLSILNDTINQISLLEKMKKYYDFEQIGKKCTKPI